jgi:carbamoyl-phosphate synthase small subunit
VATGEIVFNTTMTGYQEVVTDPSYAGQVVVMTAPHIGNYGVNAADDQSGLPHIRALVTRVMSRLDSSWRSQGGFPDYLGRHGVVALTDVDTRRLTRHVRDRGAMPVAVGTEADVDELREMAAAAPSMVGQNLASTVTTPESYTIGSEGDRRGTVVAFDLGIKRDILDAMTSRGLAVHVVPADASSVQVLEREPDGVFLSNGPGDPEPLVDTVTAVRNMLGRVPIFGICLGHQVLGRALGAATFKLPFGHHGGNHPVRRLGQDTVEITAQNHGFVVDLWSLTDRQPPERTGVPQPDLLPDRVETEFGAVVATHQNLNDGTLEGLACRDVVASSVQYHPEAAPGPNDASVLFDEFLDAVVSR